MSEFPKEIYAAPEGQFGQGVEPIKLAPWTVTPVYERSQSYIRSDIADDLLYALKTFEAHYPMGINSFLDDAFRSARAAIAKAEGRS